MRCKRLAIMSETQGSKVGNHIHSGKAKQTHKYSRYSSIFMKHKNRKIIFCSDIRRDSGSKAFKKRAFVMCQEQD